MCGGMPAGEGCSARRDSSPIATPRFNCLCSVRCLLRCCSQHVRLLPKTTVSVMGVPSSSEVS